MALPNELSAEAERTAYRQRLEVFLASRDAGRALTLESLRAGIRLETVISAAASVARYADEALAIVNDEYRPHLDCMEGCCYCCSKPGVLTSVPEFLRILDHIRTTFSADDVAALEARARRYAAQIEGRSFNDLTSASVPCPLLVDCRCSAYDVRPLVCRGYNSTDVEACRKAHDDADALVPTFAVLKDVTDGTTVGVAQSLSGSGVSDSLVDLGTALNIAMTAGAGFAATIVGGSPALLPAETPAWVSDMWTHVCETARQVGIKT
jgi:Fe-S-cluster containining protein